MTCEACGRRLDHRARGTVCYRCTMQAADFTRAWIVDLDAQGKTPDQIAAIVGVTASLVRLRLREARAVA